MDLNLKKNLPLKALRSEHIKRNKPSNKRKAEHTCRKQWAETIGKFNRKKILEEIDRHLMD